MSRIPRSEAELLAAADRDHPPPVFIIGLHRSGTTFLYATLRSLFPVTCVTAYRVLHYPELLSLAASHRARQAHRELAERFRASGQTDRKIDAIHLSPELLEEYAFVLARETGHLKLCAQSADVFEELLTKLCALEPGHTPLLKNPYDTGQVPWIAQRFPRAKFVFIRREPLHVLNSQLKAAETNAGPNAYQDMLLAGFALGRTVIRGQRLLMRLVGAPRYRRILVKLLAADFRRQTAGYARSWEALPDSRRCELRYEELVEDPPRALQPVGELLGLPLLAGYETIQPRPRAVRLLPEVEAYAGTPGFPAC